MITLDAILHQTINAHAYVANAHDCNSFAGRNYRAALAAGYDPKMVRIAIVKDERGDLHTVAEVGDTVLDQRFTWTQPKKVLLGSGYTWVWEGKPDQGDALPDFAGSPAWVWRLMSSAAGAAK